MTSFRLWDQAGRVRFTPPGVNLKIWAHLLFHALLHRRSFRIIYKRPNECFPIYLLGNTINVSWNPQNRAGIFPRWSIWGVTCLGLLIKMNIFPSICLRICHKCAVGTHQKRVPCFSKMIDLRGQMPRFSWKMNMFSHLSDWKLHECVLELSEQGLFFQDDQFEASNA